jgi:hypothetical protein
MPDFIPDSRVTMGVYTLAPLTNDLPIIKTSEGNYVSGCRPLSILASFASNLRNSMPCGGCFGSGQAESSRSGAWIRNFCQCG